MKIITVPHPALRKKSADIKIVDKKIIQFLDQLKLTLQEKTNPSGVGLAAPQVDKNIRVFCTNLPIGNDLETAEGKSQIKIYINPVIVKHSQKTTFGPDQNDPILEGCLSIPSLYGPVPRWQSIELEFDQIINQELKRTSEHYTFFPARVIQHELDHLNGILFTDFSLYYDLPIYQEDEKKRKLIEIDKKMIELF